MKRTECWQVKDQRVPQVPAGDHEMGFSHPEYVVNGTSSQHLSHSFINHLTCLIWLNSHRSQKPDDEHLLQEWIWKRKGVTSFPVLLQFSSSWRYQWGCLFCFGIQTVKLWVVTSCYEAGSALTQFSTVLELAASRNKNQLTVAWKLWKCNWSFMPYLIRQ